MKHSCDRNESTIDNTVYKPAVALLSFWIKCSAAALQVQDHMHQHGLYPVLQSSYRKNHSTETALLKVRNDILLNMNRQQVTLLVLLDFSSAFDTVSHEILLHRLHEKLGVKDTALKWFKSYLSGRTQRMIIDGKVSGKFPLSSGVPQGSCLGPLLFNIYVSSLIDVIDRHLPNAHSYADDFQLYLSFSPSDACIETTCCSRIYAGLHCCY